MRSAHSSGSKRGQATLSLVFLIGGILVIIAVTLAALVVSFLNSSYGFQASNRALAAANGGIQDAYLQLIRNKDFAPAGGAYTVPVGIYSATVAVTQGEPVAGQVTIVASSTVSGAQRKIKAILAVSTSTGEVNLISWDQLAL